MANEIEKDSLRQLKKIEKELSAIKDRTADPRRTFLNGILYGVGAFIGGVVAIVAAGWLLSFLGIVPGLDRLVPYIQALLAKIPTKF